MTRYAALKMIQRRTREPGDQHAGLLPQLPGRREDELTLDEVERIAI